MMIFQKIIFIVWLKKLLKVILNILTKTVTTDIKRFMYKSEIRIITNYENKLAQIIEQKNGNTRSTKRIPKRPHTVEPPFGVFRQQKQLNTIHVTWQEEVNNLITLKAIESTLKD